MKQGKARPRGFGSASTAEQVTDHGIDATNLTAMITGGSSGIGMETARVLALRNAHVVIAARNIEAANEAKRLILKGNKNARVDVLRLDLASLKNNAGIMFCPNQLSEDGIEIQIATYHLGHFSLTNLLLDKMKETANSTGIEDRIVNLSSVAHVHTYRGGIRFAKISDKSRYNKKRAYGQSKLANILHANELSRRLKAEGVNITANSVHPGKFSSFHLYPMEERPSGCSHNVLHCASPGLERCNRGYFLDCNEFKPSRFARDEVLAKRLWDFSNKLVNASAEASYILLPLPIETLDCLICLLMHTLVM
ncbi:Short-chain dehydrogenase B, chloroplastic [Sesamum angolense]|uniref:Short-chain dehydrogenase B, chloroplastic n=1 Tax=Sesamum angolense TaxID=2727404 RepID=A0AAE1WN47_9LAMI|nr:Short-chain dehydrogenase B, chloroplastic [Sesamum angolense]